LIINKGKTMKRRDFLKVGALSAITLTVSRQLLVSVPAQAADTITAKNILKEGQPTTIANYCENPEKQPNKVCPNRKEGTCDTCLFYLKATSAATFKGQAYAKCQLLADPAKPQYVAAKAWCATYAKKA
jgi:hypothetical protein